MLEMRISAKHHTSPDHHHQQHIWILFHCIIVTSVSLLLAAAAPWLTGLGSYDHNGWVGPIIFTRRTDRHQSVQGSLSREGPNIIITGNLIHRNSRRRLTFKRENSWETCLSWRPWHGSAPPDCWLATVSRDSRPTPELSTPHSML